MSTGASALRIFIALAASRQLEELFVAAACWSPGTAAPDCAGACFEVASHRLSGGGKEGCLGWRAHSGLHIQAVLIQKLCRAMASRIGIPGLGLRPASS